MPSKKKKFHWSPVTSASVCRGRTSAGWVGGGGGGSFQEGFGDLLDVVGVGHSGREGGGGGGVFYGLFGGAQDVSWNPALGGW